MVPKTGIRLLLKWTKLESVNNMYTRTKVGMTLSKAARDFKSNVSKQVRLQLPKNLPFTNKDTLKLTLRFILNKRFFQRDTSNFIKLVEDTIYEELDINDAMNIELYCNKSYLPKSKEEYIVVTVEKSDFNYSAYNEESTTKEIKLEDRVYTKEEVEDVYSLALLTAHRLGESGTLDLVKDSKLTREFLNNLLKNE